MSGLVWCGSVTSLGYASQLLKYSNCDKEVGGKVTKEAKGTALDIINWKDDIINLLRFIEPHVCTSCPQSFRFLCRQM